jgi:tRNA A37 threonylcarbamoyladenosine dehydratase
VVFLEKWNIRTEMLIGKDGIEKLSKLRVGIFGVGGVGSFAAEAIARCGVGTIVLVDFDYVSPSNINRQIHALIPTIGSEKVLVMRDRILQINPAAKVTGLCMYLDEYNVKEVIDCNQVDYVVDAMDHVNAKIALITYCVHHKIPIISSMGAGNKFDPTKLVVADISKTHTCPLARRVRMKLKERGITKGVKTVFSTESPRKPVLEGDSDLSTTFSPPGSIAYLPSSVGLLLASVVINDTLSELI